MNEDKRAVTWRNDTKGPCETILAGVHSRGERAARNGGGPWDDGDGGPVESGGVAEPARGQGGGVSLGALVSAVQGGVGGLDVGLLPLQGLLGGQCAAPQQHHLPHGTAERLADEAVQEEVDGRVEHGQHVGQVVGQVDAPVPVNRRHMQVVDDHHRPGSPEHREGGGDGQQHGRGLPQAAQRHPHGPALVAAARLPLAEPQRMDDQRVQDQEDAAGQEVDDGHVGPDEDGVQRAGRVAVPPHV